MLRHFNTSLVHALELLIWEIVSKTKTIKEKDLYLILCFGNRYNQAHRNLKSFLTLELKRESFICYSVISSSTFNKYMSTISHNTKSIFITLLNSQKNQELYSMNWMLRNKVSSIFVFNKTICTRANSPTICTRANSPSIKIKVLVEWLWYLQKTNPLNLFMTLSILMAFLNITKDVQISKCFWQLETT